MKFCNTCNKNLALVNFSKCNRDGYQSKCKSCKSIYQKQNRDKKLIWQAKYRNDNREELKSKRRKYYSENKEKEKIYGKLWDKNNPDKRRYGYAKRRALKKLAMPKWLTDEQVSKIKEIYKNCPDGFHVDHIIPLQGKIVCGLHVPENLQYLTKKENLSKGNKFEG